MNKFEILQKQFNSDMDDAQQKVAQQYAAKFVAAFRKHLAGFKLNNHTILISSGMGSCTIVIKHKPSEKETFLSDYEWLRSTQHDDSVILNELRFIEAQLDWDWAYNLNDTPLN